MKTLFEVIPLPRRNLTTRDYILAFLAAIMLTLAFPRFDVEILAFAALIPLLVALEGLTAWQGAWLGFVFGCFWAQFMLYWLSPATTPGFILVVVYQGLFTALFGGFYAAARRWGKVPAVLAAPALWMGMEWLRSVGYLAFPWTMLAYSQYKWNLLIQIADVAGLWPVSLAVVAVNALLYLILKDYRRIPTWLRAGGATAGLLGILCLYGALARVNPHEGRPLKIAVVQPNIDQDVKWDPAYREETIRALFEKTFEAQRDGAGLVIWPETATPFYLMEEDYYRNQLQTFADEYNIPILTGTVERKPRLTPIRGHKDYRYNAAVLVAPHKGVVGNYAKIRLVPFGEHIPWDADVPAVADTLFQDSGDFTPGWGWRVIRGPGYNIGCFICFEIVFPEISRAYSRAGADFLVNVTNEGWFGNSNEPHQALAMAVFRAVENRTWLVRAANTGVTCFIDPNGKVVRKSKVYIRNQLTDYVYTRQWRSFYADHGDWLGVVLAAVAGLAGLWSVGMWARAFWVLRRRRGGD